jgi:hypothetical protein
MKERKIVWCRNDITAICSMGREMIKVAELIITNINNNN